MTVMDWIVSPSINLYIEALPLNKSAFGDRTFTKVIKVKWNHKGEVLMQ